MSRLGSDTLRLPRCSFSLRYSYPPWSGCSRPKACQSWRPVSFASWFHSRQSGWGATRPSDTKTRVSSRRYFP